MGNIPNSDSALGVNQFNLHFNLLFRDLVESCQEVFYFKFFTYFFRFKSGLCKIHLENLGAMCPDPWYSTYHYSHPPLVERLGAMMELDKKKA